MQTLRHQFLVLYSCQQHNKSKDKGDRTHLNTYSFIGKEMKQKNLQRYECQMKETKEDWNN